MTCPPNRADSHLGSRSTEVATQVLAPLIAPGAPPFALLHREGRDHLEVLLGRVEDVPTLADIPLPADASGPAAHDVLALVPFRQITERGFAAHDDGVPLRCLRVEQQVALPLSDALAVLPDEPVRLEGGGFDIDDETYAAVVTQVITEEIGRGEGANFVIRRDFRARIANWSAAVAASTLRRLLRAESGAYWTYLVHTGDLTLVGASPERHVSAHGDEVVMNPISGTYRYPAQGPDREGLLRFLRDDKEVDELFMVLDEELKMMSQVCELGGRVHGPHLKEMGHLAHTEYVLRGHSTLDVRQVLRATMFAPTVTGSPLQNACRVIHRHESSGRGYYSGVLALIGRDGDGRRTLDAPILIRTAHVAADGTVAVPVGATLVRHSTPEHEVAETHAKAAGVLAALGAVPPATPRPAGAPLLGQDPRVQRLLARRNDHLAPFWLTDRTAPGGVGTPRLDGPRPGRTEGRRALVVDGEDAFTAMLSHLMRSLGMRVETVSWARADAADAEAAELLVLGPGPGDPRDAREPKTAALRALAAARLAVRRPLFAVCLGHQAVCAELGLELVRRPVPHQGRQLAVDLFGRTERTGFYNTFAALRADVPEAPDMEFAAAPDTGEVHAMRSRRLRLAGVQFHPESVLTTHGIDLVRDLLPPA